MSNSDQDRWNEKYRQGRSNPDFTPHPLIRDLENSGQLDRLPNGPVLELACGLSGSALRLAERGFDLLAIDISDVALDQLAAEARRRNLWPRITFQQFDLNIWQPPAAAFSLLLCTKYWDRLVFERALNAIMPGGLLVWQTFTLDYLCQRPTFRAEWCLAAGEPASLLTSDFQLLEQRDIDQTQRRIIAQKQGSRLPLA
jgi:hypothetical protein